MAPLKVFSVSLNMSKCHILNDQSNWMFFFFFFKYLKHTFHKNAFKNKMQGKKATHLYVGQI